jgi:predicted transcriptional regulator
MEQQPIVVDLDDELYAQLSEMAAEANRSVSDYMGDIIEEEFRKRHSQQAR